MCDLILNQKADMVIGDRLSTTYYKENKRPFHNLGNKIVKFSINKLFKTNIKDIMTGYRAFNKRFVKFTRFIFAYVHLIKPVLRKLADGKLHAYQYPWFVDFIKDVDVNSSAVKNFEDYTESFVTWLRQLETLQGREISLIKYSMFLDNPARLTSPDEFKSCDGQETDLTLHELWYRLSESRDTNSSIKGFGKFLRHLYEACDVSSNM